MPTEPKPLPSRVKSLGWVSFLNDIAGEMLYPLLPAFLLSIGGGAASLGMLEGIADAVGAGIKWLTGARSDRLPRRKPLVVAGYAVAAFVRPLLSLAHAPWQVVAVRTVDRIGNGIRTAPRDALLVEGVPADRRGAAFAFHRMMDNFGAVAGPIVAFTLARSGLDIRTIFALAIVPGLLSLATVGLGVKEEARPAKAGKLESSEARKLPREARTYLATLAVFTLGASADSFLLLHLMKLGLDKSYVPLAWLTLSASKALTNMPGGRLSDRIGHRPTLVMAWLLYAAVYATIPFAKSVTVCWIIIVIYGAYYGLSEGGAKAVLADMVPPDARGRGYGALNAVTGICILPANALFGFLYGKDARFAFWAGAGFAAVAAILLALEHARIDPRKKE
jgi:MFS family permease